MKHFEKLFAFKAIKAGIEITAEVLAKINSFALEPLTAEQVYVRKFLFCHSGIDRDVERFPKALLDDFTATFPGKSFLFNHDRRTSPFGLFFDAKTEDMTPEQFKALTGLEPKLPDGEKTITIVWAWAYMLDEDFNAQITKNLDAGIYRHVSIGFNATDLRGVKTEINGPTLYWEYVAPGEALEGSLVWLGAQPGATSQKALKDQETIDHGGKNIMKTLVVLLTAIGIKSLVAEATEEQIAAGVKALLEEKETRIKELEQDAILGKAYREKLLDDYVKAKAKLGECEATPEAQDTVKKAAKVFDVKFLEDEVKHLEKRVAEKFPAEPQLPADDPNANRGKAAGDNPLIPAEEK
jgi:hypothetical protein